MEKGPGKRIFKSTDSSAPRLQGHGLALDSMGETRKATRPRARPWAERGGRGRPPALLTLGFCQPRWGGTPEVRDCFVAVFTVRCMFAPVSPAVISDPLSTPYRTTGWYGGQFKTIFCRRIHTILCIGAFPLFLMSI